MLKCYEPSVQMKSVQEGFFHLFAFSKALLYNVHIA